MSKNIVILFDDTLNDPQITPIFSSARATLQNSVQARTTTGYDPLNLPKDPVFVS